MKIILPDLKAEEIIELYIKMKQDYDLRRAVMFLKLLRYSYSSGGKFFACQPFSVVSLFQLIEQVGKWLVSYNDCTEIRGLYDGYSFFDFTRLHNMKQRINAGEQFPELLISNYDMYERQRNKPLQLSLLDLTIEQQIDLEQILKECILRKH